MSNSETTANRNYPLFDLEGFVEVAGPLLLQALEMVDGDVHRLMEAVGKLAPEQHQHSIEDITDLQLKLNGKSGEDHGHTLGELTNVAAAADTAPVGSILWKSLQGWIVGNPATVLGPHQHTIANVEGLADALSAKAAAQEVDSRFGSLEQATTAALEQRLRKDQHLGDLPDKAAARANLGLSRSVPAMTGTAPLDTNLDNLVTPGFDKQLHRGTQPGGWGVDDYAYLLVLEYASGFVTQFTFPYAGGAPRFRDLYGGVWTRWKTLAHVVVSTSPPSGPMEPGEIWAQVS